MKFLAAIFVAMMMFVIFGKAIPTADSTTPREVYQGKPILWWAKHTVQARKDANVRGQTIEYLKAVNSRLNISNHHLKFSMTHDDTIQDCVKMATITYSAFSESRAWQIIFHESWTSGKQFAKNPSSTATGLYQFLTSTWASTPYGRAGLSINSPCATSLGAGWMHQVGRGREWAY